MDGQNNQEDNQVILEKLTEQNRILKEQLDRAESIENVRVLGGQSDAGNQEQTQEQKEIESARSLLKGTGFEDTLFPN
jgi:hypothetical protein